MKPSFADVPPESVLGLAIQWRLRFSPAEIAVALALIARGFLGAGSCSRRLADLTLLDCRYAHGAARSLVKQGLATSRLGNRAGRAKPRRLFFATPQLYLSFGFAVPVAADAKGGAA